MAARCRNCRTFLRPRKRFDRSRSSWLHPHRRSRPLTSPHRAVQRLREMHRRRLPETSLRRSQQGHSHRSGRLAPSPRFARRSRSDFLGNAARASSQGPRHVRRAVAHSLPHLRPFRFRTSPRPPSFEQDGRLRHHDRARAPHLRTMDQSARTHQEDCPRSLCPGARIFRLGQVELRRHSKTGRHREPGFCTSRFRALRCFIPRCREIFLLPLAKNLKLQLKTPCHFQLAFSPPPDMMAAFRASLETSHCLNRLNLLPQRVHFPRSAAGDCSKFSACGSEWLWLSEMRLPRESFERPVKLPGFFPTHGSLSVCGSPADSTHFSAPLPWPNSARPFPAAAVSTISLGAPLAITPGSSSAGATGSPPAAPLPSPSSSPSTAATSFPYLLAT